MHGHEPDLRGFSMAEPASEGFDAARLERAIAFARDEAETPWGRALSRGIAEAEINEPPPWNDILGPTRPRGGPNGIILRHGKVVGRWGDIHRVDMTFSVTKSYLSLLAGLAVADGLIRSIDDPMREYALDDGFDSAQNRTITWRHMLTQTSEWEGELWGKPDLIDRNRRVGPGVDNSAKGTHRDLQKPGTFYEYNDVRVNRLSLSLMQVFRRPLPAVLKERIMDPIGCSADWEWHGYRNSWIDVGGERMQSVPGGCHWGGGIWIGTADHMRVAELVRRNGEWEGRQLIPASWIAAIRTPSPVYPRYGLLWWLNTGREPYPGVPETSFFARGAGSSVLWVDQELALTAVIRWIDQKKIADFLTRVVASLK
jgi:CubicO group peptidase (beta-lactamase class C family)